MSLKRLEGRVAVVTGGAQGIGAAIARRLANEGAKVAVLDIKQDAAASVLPAPHIGLACDVTDTASVDKAFAEIEATFGTVHILVNNAGIGSAPNDGMDRYYGALYERAAKAAEGSTDIVYADQTIYCEDEGWSKVLSVTLDGVFRCSRAAVRIMARRGNQGSIINIGSTAAVKGDGPLPYCAAKAAVLGITRSMARELADRQIRVNAVNPGATETPIYDTLPVETKNAIAADSVMKRLAHPDEITGAVAFLASDDASFATGSIVTVNGGSYFT